MAYIICTGNIAVHPYTIKDCGLNIYSLDELCYYIHNNIFDLNEDFVNGKLIGFISEELGLYPLANRLKDMRKIKKPEYEQLIAIVSEGDYLTAQELLDFKTSIARLAGCQSLQRYKLKADSLLKKGAVDRAIYNYSLIVKDNDFRQYNDIFKSYVYYNMAVANAYIFHYDEAFKDFYSAYRYKKDDRNAFGCLMSLYLSIENKDDFMKRAIDFGFSISRVAHTEELIKDCIQNAGRLEEKDMADVVASARIAMS